MNGLFFTGRELSFVIFILCLFITKKNLYIKQIVCCYVPGLYTLFFPMVRNGIVNFCSEFLDERVLVRDVEHTSGIGEIILL